MDWLATTQARRSVAPNSVKAASIIMLGMSYGRRRPPPRWLKSSEISPFMRETGYHDLIKGRLKLLAAWLVAQAKTGSRSSSIPRRSWKSRWRRRGISVGQQAQQSGFARAWLLAFLGSIFTDAARARQPEPDRCGTCHACLHLPDKGFPRPYCSMPAVASPISRSNTKAISAAVPAADRKSHFWLRRLSCGLSLEQIRGNGARSKLQAREDAVRAVNRRSAFP
jgi:hypothetical protein